MKYKLQIFIFSVMMMLICFGTWLLSLNYVNQGVFITEVRSDYGNILYDSDGSNHGFVEIYNNSNKSIDLNGWYITDSKNNLFKYKINDCIIEPNQYVVFWSNELEDVMEILNDGYFLGYSLDKGESVILSDDEGKTIDKIVIPELEKGKSYSRAIESDFWYKSQPTPMFVNSEELSYSSVEKPKFSKKSGFYDNGMEITIKADNGCKIYYTTDGSQPTTESKIYEGKLVLNDNSENNNRWSSIEDITLTSGYIPQTNLNIENVIPSHPVPKINVIKAIAEDKYGNISETASASYFVGYNDKYGFEDIMTMSITTNENNLFGSEIGIYTTGNIWDKYNNKGGIFPYTAYTNYSISGKGWRRPAKVELFDSNKNIIESLDIAISIHGGWSVAHNQKSFNLFAQPDDAGNEILFKSLFSGKQQTLMLRAGGFRDTYSTKVRDVLNQTMMKDTNVLATNFIPCQVFINGEYWGLYNLQERIDASLIAGHYGVNPENAIVLKNFVVVSGEPDESQLFEDVITYAVENNLAENENYNKLCQMIDIESFIDYYIFQTYVANCDSIANNYSVWRSRNIVDGKYADGRWRWILYDTDDSANMVIGLTQPETDSFSSGHWAKAPMQDELFTALIENESFKLKFTERFIYMAKNNFSQENVLTILAEFEKTYAPAVTVSHRRFMKSDYAENEYYEQTQSIKDFYAKRYEYIYQHMVKNLELEVYGY